MLLTNTDLETRFKPVRWIDFTAYLFVWRFLVCLLRSTASMWWEEVMVQKSLRMRSALFMRLHDNNISNLLISSLTVLCNFDYQGAENLSYIFSPLLLTATELQHQNHQLLLLIGLILLLLLLLLLQTIIIITKSVRSSRWAVKPRCSRFGHSDSYQRGFSFEIDFFFSKAIYEAIS